MTWCLCKFEDNNPPDIIKDFESLEEAEAFYKDYSKLMVKLHGRDFFFEESLAGYSYGIVREDQL